MPQSSYAFEFGTNEKYIYYSVCSGDTPKTAKLFWNMHHYCWLKLDWPEAFIKANPEQVKFAIDPVNPRNEYRYEIGWDGKVTAYRKHMGGLWEMFFQDHYAEFINQYNEDELPSLYKLSQDVGYGEKYYCTLIEIEIHLGRLKSFETSKFIKKEIARWEKEYQRIYQLNYSMNPT